MTEELPARHAASTNVTFAMLLLNAERTSMRLGCLLTLCHAESFFYSSNPAHSCYISMKQAALSTAVYMTWLGKRCLPAVQLLAAASS